MASSTTFSSGVSSGVWSTVKGPLALRSPSFYELGILALDKDTPEGPVCENVIACCPGQGARCVGFGSGTGSGSGYSD
ncbi:hypothetical protein CBS147482_8395 [Aspergillus niger]|nr:hypothetical protein CBS147371_8811 [Aspergillus niger]KAI2968387.1 hypothetical protein CBS147324_6486 [Aspergillus niger]KAI2994667.1 hypothetical protein CBS147482_8395 [Aspergillus niger]KAI3041038.1 hypothetical protein CBS147352_9674 [Aspergillus niger]